MHKTGLILAIAAICVAGCKSNKMEPENLTNIQVARNMEERPASNTTAQSVTRQESPSPENKTESNYVPRSRQKATYHIIVASYVRSERAKAEKLVKDLKTKHYPAQLIDAKGRLRISIESFSEEQEAQQERDKYREITDRQDIWILKMTE